MAFGRCVYQICKNGVYYCVYNKDATGRCHGICGKYKEVMTQKPPYICPKCNQLLSATEDYMQTDERNEQLRKEIAALKEEVMRLQELNKKTMIATNFSS